MEKTTLLTSNAWLYLATGELLSIGMFLFGFTQQEFGTCLIAIACGYLSYLLFFKARLEFTADHLTIVNPFVRHRIGWQDIQTMATGLNFFVVKNGRKINAFAAPAPSRHHQGRLNQANLTGTEHAGKDNIRPSESPVSDSGSALIVAQRYAASGQSGQSSKRVDVLSIIILLGLVVAGFLI